MTIYTAEQIERIGGQRWAHPRTGEIRIYLNDWPDLVGLEIERYGTGNIRYASLAREPVSNTRAPQAAGRRADLLVRRRAAQQPGRGAELVRRLHQGIARKLAAASGVDAAGYPVDETEREEAWRREGGEG